MDERAIGKVGDFNGGSGGEDSALILRRLRWRSRRGLLENDLLLSRFLDRQGVTLDGTSLATLGRLLECEDQDLWALLSGRERCDDPALQAMVDRIRAD